MSEFFIILFWIINPVFTGFEESTIPLPVLLGTGIVSGIINPAIFSDTRARFSSQEV
ncbi:MAG TPA: hypothetical protein PLY78_10395 [Methanospirillum sp.]|nr:hypothetical protein [Methanospirillum sp.]